MLNTDRMQQQLIALGGTYLMNHARRTHAIAKKLAEMETLAVDGDVLLFACYFHDIGAFKPFRPDGPFDHAEESAKLMPSFTSDYGIRGDRAEIVAEAVRFHDKRGQGKANETILLRNADAVDYLGFIAAARDFSKQPNDMRKALAALNKHRRDYAALLELDAAIRMAEPRIRKLDLFIAEFEKETYSLY